MGEMDGTSGTSRDVATRVSPAGSLVVLSADARGGMPASGRVVAVCVSERKGTRKRPVDAIELAVGLGVVGDAHAGAWHRQVSLLPDEAVDELRDVLPGLAPGDFAENVLVRGLDLKALPVGSVLAVGTALVAVTQIGKTCHNDCEIRRLTGRCAMPTEGVFGVVVRGGRVAASDGVRVVEVVPAS